MTRHAALALLGLGLCVRTAHSADPAESGDYFGSAVASGDFNGDGYVDLAIGVRYEDIGTIAEAGAVEVIYGSATQLVAANRQFWHEDVANVEDSAEHNDVFGFVLGSGDFNCDGYDDLAISVSLDANSPYDAGRVHVIYGSPAGLSATYVPDQLWDMAAADLWDDHYGIPVDAQPEDVFGASLAAGDFNGDACDDLAIGVPGQDVGGHTNAGAVAVFYGSPSRLASGGQYLHRDGAPFPCCAASYADFGDSLAADDFNGDGVDDLAIGVPFENIGAVATAGAVNVIYGSSVGLSDTPVATQFWHQDVPEIQDVAESYDYFGRTMTTGDFNGDGRADLAIGAYGETVGAAAFAGAVNVIYGSPAGLSATFVANQFWHQDTANVEDVPEERDALGQSLAAGDFNGDGRDDLAIGAPTEDVVAWFDDAGAVNVIYGSASGLSATIVPDQYWNQNVADVNEVVDSDDAFGYALAAGDFNGDGRSDLAIGAPGEGASPCPFPWTYPVAGAVNVLYGSATSLSATVIPDQLWMQACPATKK